MIRRCSLHRLSKHTVQFSKLRTRQCDTVPNDFVNDIRLRRVERRRVVPNVLGAEKYSVRQVFQEHAGLDQAGNWFKTEAADGLYFFIDLAQLGNSIVGKTQTVQCFEIFRTGEFLVRRPQRPPDD